MKRLFATVAVLLNLHTLTLAQDADRPPRGQGYIFIGAATHQLGASAGFGGEFYSAMGLGGGFEGATVGFNSSANGNSNWIGMGSADVTYHFFRKKIEGHAVPFVSGGYTSFFGQDTLTYPLPTSGCAYSCGGNHTNGFNIGGGADILVAKHAGVRFDLRYYGHGGRILWASFPNDAQLNFVAFRIGLTFR
jgi:hypothetical protein